MDERELIMPAVLPLSWVKGSEPHFVSVYGCLAYGVGVGRDSDRVQSLNIGGYGIHIYLVVRRLHARVSITFNLATSYTHVDGSTETNQVGIEVSCGLVGWNAGIRVALALLSGCSILEVWDERVEVPVGAVASKG